MAFFGGYTAGSAEGSVDDWKNVTLAGAIDA